MNSLDAHEGRWKAQFDLATNSSSYYSSLYFSSIRIGASIVTKVVENLQVRCIVKLTALDNTLINLVYLIISIVLFTAKCT